LNNLTISNTVEYIGKSAFCSTSITEVTIPASVKTICEYAFYKCPLESATLENATGWSVNGEYAVNQSGAITFPVSYTCSVYRSLGGSLDHIAHCTYDNAATALSQEFKVTISYRIPNVDVVSRTYKLYQCVWTRE